MSTVQHDLWEMFEDHFAKAIPGGKCAKVNVTFRSKDDEKITVAITREGFVEWLEDFESEEEAR